MSARTTSVQQLGNLALVIVALCGEVLPETARGAPAPKSKIYALLYIPKKSNQFETIQNRRRRIDSIKSRYTLYAAIRSLKGVELSSLPKKGKGRGLEDYHDEDVAWTEQHLHIEYLDGTGVIRIALDAGTPYEQALLVNAVVHGYFHIKVHREQEDHDSALEHYQKDTKVLKQMMAGEQGEKKQIIERHILEIEDFRKRTEEARRTLPRVLELADVPPK